MTSSPLPVFDFVSGWLFLLTFLCFCFCVATLKNHVDVTKLTTPDEINRAVRSSIPKREVLTKQGLFRYKLAIVSLLISMGTLAAILTRNLAR